MAMLLLYPLLLLMNEKKKKTVVALLIITGGLDLCVSMHSQIPLNAAPVHGICPEVLVHAACDDRGILH